MALENGTRLGPYEITASIGAGGMGEVYRATDTRLGRTVAVKVLSGKFSAREGGRERFRREARAISSLSHPRICALHDVGQEGALDFLVLEHLEGETLAERIRRGPLQVGEAIRIGAQIAEGLEVAHRQGLIHRDLKPGNIMLTSSGVKLMDFGLAKAVGREGPVDPAALSSAPTESSPLTADGVVVGTLQYISPEQLQGREAESGSDLFSLGAILHEMLTGRRAFAADTAAGLMAVILTADPPPVSALRPSIPPRLDQLIRGCLAKDPEQRRRSAHDLKLDLQTLSESPGEEPGDRHGAGRGGFRVHLLWGAVAAVLALLAGLAWLGTGSSSLKARPVQFTMSAPDNLMFSVSVETHNIAVSPGGEELAFVAVQSGEPWIWIRSLGSSVARRLPGTAGAMSPFWSPDGRNIAFFAKGHLLKVPVDGGPAQTLCAVTGVEWTGDWGPGGAILFSEFLGREGLYRVPATGGAAVLEVDPGEARQSGFRWPHWLPGGRRFLYSAFDENEELAVYAGTLDGGKPERILPVPTRAQYGSGYLVYARHKTLMAQPFDPQTLRISGEPLVLTDGLPYFLTGWAPYSVSAGGVLAYQSGDTSSQLRWFDRQGRNLSDVGEPADFVSARLSPDGRRIAAVIDTDGENSDIWIIDASRGSATRFTAQPGRKSPAVWSPDSERIVYGLHGRKVAGGIFVKAVGESKGRELVPRRSRFQFPSEWSEDGRWILYSRLERESGFDIWVQAADAGGESRELFGTEFHDVEGVLSRDGKWMAYLSDEAGRSTESLQVTPGTLDLYVRPFDRPGEPVRISSTGAYSHRWSRDGRELFFVTASGDVQAAAIEAGDEFLAGEPVTLFRLPSLPDPEGVGAMFSVAADGERFLTAVGGTAAHLPVTVTVDWAAGLGR